MLVDIIAWVVLGLIAGALAKLIYPGHQGGGILATIGLGILGALIGGFIANAVGVATTGFIWSLVFAIIGAMILIFIWGLLTRRTT